LCIGKDEGKFFSVTATNPRIRAATDDKPSGRSYVRVVPQGLSCSSDIDLADNAGPWFVIKGFTTQ